MTIARRALPKRPALTLSAISFGAAQGGNLGRPTDEGGYREAVDAAWDGGMRYFDTAPHYGLGLSERRLGDALRDRPRDEYVLSTKVGRALDPSPGTAHESDLEHGGFDVPATHRRRWDFSRDGVLRSLEESLGRLDLDRVDIVYVHDPDEHEDSALREALPTLADLRDQGVVGAIGAGMNQSAMLARFISACDIDVVMCAGRYTLLEQGALDDLLPLAAEHGVGVVIAGVYNSGLLARPRPPADAKYDYATAPPEVLQRAHVLADVCESHGVTLPEVALSFVRAHPAVVSTVVGMRDVRQVADTLDRAAAEIPAALWADIRAQELLDERAPAPGEATAA